RCALFETRVVNHRHRRGSLELCRIMRCTKASSPPWHHSSPALPPKFSTVPASLPLRWLRFRRLLAAASSADAWKGGLHIDRSKVSPGLITPLKHSSGDACNRQSIRPATARLAATSVLAHRQ